MESIHRSKRRRVYSFQPTTIALANFYNKYMAYLLPALIKAGSSTRSCQGMEDKVEKIVRFEVDMALVVSTTGLFRWSRGLKRKLEQGDGPEKSRRTSQIQAKTSPFLSLWMSPTITRSLVPAGVRMKAKANGARPRRAQHHRKRRAKFEDLGGCVQKLRSILPGGEEMGVCELLSEVGSYVVCLELQVSILGSLLKDH